MSESVKFEPCDECGVDTLALLKERDQLLAEVERLTSFLNDRICIHHNDAERAAITCPVCLTTALDTERAQSAAYEKALRKIRGKCSMWANDVIDETLTPPTIEQERQ